MDMCNGIFCLCTYQNLRDQDGNQEILLEWPNHHKLSHVIISLVLQDTQDALIMHAITKMKYHNVARQNYFKTLHTGIH